MPGGGIGDLFRESYYHNVLGILKRFKLEHSSAHLTLLLMSHNPRSLDLFVGQSWIDEVKLLPFVAEDLGNWPSCYQDYAGEFADCTELRLNIADHRSNYRADLTVHRPRTPSIKFLPGVGTSWSPVLTAAEWSLVDRYAGRVVFHPYAGSFHRSIADDVREFLISTYGAEWVTVGANYDREGHVEERDVVELPPRVLVEVLRRCPAVIGTESSVYYIASMLGTPTCLLYRDGHAFSRWVNEGDATWDWFFNNADTRSRFVRMPLNEAGLSTLKDWIQQERWNHSV
jgi:hypothetical protein